MSDETFQRFVSLVENENDWLCIESIEDARGTPFVLWEKVEEEVETPPIIKSVGVVECSAKEAYDFVLDSDLETRKQWDASIQKCEIVQELSTSPTDVPSTRLMHYVYHAPFPVKSRDFVVLRSFVEEPHRVIWAESVEDDQLPFSGSYVRGEVLLSGYYFEEVSEKGASPRCRITTIQQMDPKGWIPTFVMHRTKSKPLHKLVQLSQLLSS